MSNSNEKNESTCMESAEAPVDSGSNWLEEYLILIMWFIFAVAAIIISIAVNNSFNPLHWGGRSGFVVTVVLVMTCCMVLLYLEQQNKLSVEKYIQKVFNMDEYTDPPKKILDVILTHYTNVATIGMFLALAMYSTKPLVNWSPAATGFVLAILVAAAFFIYALFLLRLVKRFVNSQNNWGYLFIVTTIFIVDSKAVEMLIKGIPQTGA